MKNSTYWTINFILVLVCVIYFMTTHSVNQDDFSFINGLIVLFLFSTINSVAAIPKLPRPRFWEDDSFKTFQIRTQVFLLESLGLSVILAVSVNTSDSQFPMSTLFVLITMLSYYSLPVLLSRIFRYRITLLAISPVIFTIQFFLFAILIPMGNLSNSFLAISTGIIGIVLMVLAFGLNAFLFLYFFMLLGQSTNRGLFWKEKWEILPSFGIALLVIGILGFIGISTDFPMSGIIYIFTLLYGAFLGARAFAGEKEHNTYNYLLTCPLKPLTILLNKYLSGLGFLILLSLFTYGSLLAANNLSGINCWATTFGLIGIYSFCFLFSIFLQDTLRSALFGFIGFGISVGLPYLYYMVFNTHFPSPNHHCLDSYLLINLILYIMIILGVIGITFYSYRRKQFHWQNGFTWMILIAVLLGYTTDRLIFGNLKPINTQYNHVSTLDNLYAWKGYIYSIEAIPSGTVNPLAPSDIRPCKYIFTDTDYSDPTNPKLMRTLTTEKMSLAMKFDQGILYTLETSSQGWELAKYELDNHPNGVCFTCHCPMEIKSPIAGDIFLNGKQIIVAYTAITGYQSNIIKTNNFSNTTTIKIPLTARYYVLIEHSMNRHYINRDPLIDFPNLGKKCHTYDNHTLIYDEQNNNLTYYFDKNSTNKTETDWISQANIELSHITHNDFAYTIQDDYLYLSDNEKALAIYGLAASPGFNIYGSIAWDWRDKFTSFNHPYQNNNNNRYQMKQSRNLFVDRNRAILVQTNGFCVFDITSPEHPRKIAQQSIQPIMNWTYDDHRLYISNQKGMTVFQIP